MGLNGILRSVGIILCVVLLSVCHGPAVHGGDGAEWPTIDGKKVLGTPVRSRYDPDAKGSVYQFETPDGATLVVHASSFTDETRRAIGIVITQRAKKEQARIENERAQIAREKDIEAAKRKREAGVRNTRDNLRNRGVPAMLPSAESMTNALQYCVTEITIESSVPVAIALLNDKNGKLNQLKRVLDAGGNAQQVMDVLAKFSEVELSLMAELAQKTDWGRWVNKQNGERLTNGRALQDAYEIYLRELEAGRDFGAKSPDSEPQLDGVFASRGSAAKFALSQGGGADTESAVDRALKWLSSHQTPNGSWTCNLDKVPACLGKCSRGSQDPRGGPGGATAMALLPFLGRGNTHTRGPYKPQVEAGIAFLVSLAMKNNGKGYTDGENLYSQSLVGIALSESYGMTNDKRIAPLTQAVLKHIVDAQDAEGGWRYSPREPANTSAVGWMLSALHAGRLASLEVPPEAMTNVSRFLDSVQGNEYGSAYGDASPGDNIGTSAIGLNARTYLGWTVATRGMKDGAARIAATGPTSDLCYDYYATRLMHRIGGEQWLTWNNEMKTMLLGTQATTGHEAGSWHTGFEQGHDVDVLGRLYTTVLATLILEEYYR